MQQTKINKIKTGANDKKHETHLDIHSSRDGCGTFVNNVHGWRPQSDAPAAVFNFI